MSFQKRKRSSSVASASSYASSHSLPLDAINPHSYSKGTIKQLRVAGLTEDDLLPSTYIPNFPHRPILSSNLIQPDDQEEEEDDDDEDDEDDEEEDDDDDDDDNNDEEAEKYEHSDSPSDGSNEDSDFSSSSSKAKRAKNHARRQIQETRTGVLVNVILRLLEEGDIPRARRAFGLLPRTTIHGIPVDLRRNGLWALGAEVLMRDGEERRVRSTVTVTANPAGNPAGDDKDEDEDEDEGQDDAGKGAGEAGMATGPVREVRRWGSAANMPQLRAYLEGLIRQYPYIRQFSNRVSALNFHIVLFGCELYNTWVEHKLALERLEQDSEAWSDDLEIPDVDPYSDDDNYEDKVRLPDRERRLRQEAANLGLQAMSTMRDVATRMDSLLENAPYNRSVDMLRLRGMVALYVADLSMPPPPRTGEEEEEEEEEGRRIRTEERERARTFFLKMKESGGRVDAFIEKWLDGADDDEYGTDEDDDMMSVWSEMPVFSTLPTR